MQSLDHIYLLGQQKENVMIASNNFQLHIIEIHALQLFALDSTQKYENDLLTLETIAQVTLSLQLIYV